MQDRDLYAKLLGLEPPWEVIDVDISMEAEGVIPGQPVAEAVRQAQHPLAHGHPREHMVDEMRGPLGDAPPPTARAETPAVTRQGHQAVEPTPLTPEPRETSAECATLQEIAKLLLDEAGQALSVAEVSHLGAKGLEVVAHHLKQNTGGGLSRFVGWRRGGHTRPTA